MKTKIATVRYCAGTIQRCFPFIFSAALLFLIVSCHEGVMQTATEGESLSGAELFSSQCRKCHGLRRVISASKDEETWINTIKRMKDKNRADISGSQVEQLVRYHVERQKREAEVFKSRCQQCHPGSRFVEKPLTPEQARAVVKKMQEKAGNTIADEDVELIINYHIREHQFALKKNLQGAMGKILDDSNIDPETLTLFVAKCSSCHEAERSLYVFKDEEAWQKTIVKMQAYSREFITDEDVRNLVAFHVKRQKSEIEIFRETCLACHSGERIFRHSMSDEEWNETVNRMHEKAPALINEEKIKVLASFHRKQESVMAGLFEGQCRQCHIYINRSASMNTGARNSLIILANEKFTDELSKPDIDSLISFHAERERREMEVFRDCSKCHPEGRSKRYNPRKREDWILLISSMQDKVFNQKVASSIDTQLSFHVDDYNQ